MNATTLQVRNTVGSLPPLWDRQVIFFANLLGLFFGNTDETGELRRQVGSLSSYGGRLIPILGRLYQGKGSNLVVLEREPDATLLGYFRDTLGLSLPECLVLPHNSYVRFAEGEPGDDEELAAFLERLRRHPGTWLDGFVTDRALEAVAANLGRQTVSTGAASQAGNNKFMLHRHLLASNLPVFDTLIAERPADVGNRLRALRRQGYRSAVIKSQIGASGIGLLKLGTSDPGDEIPSYLFYEGPCLVQGWMDTAFDGIQAVHSPSVQLFLDDQSLNLYDLTEQILDSASIHEGNLAPPPWLGDDEDTRRELLRQAEIAGRWLHEQGYRGTASVDFHVAEHASVREVRVCEINARVTGATYPSILARHFAPGGAWLMRNLRFATPVAGPEVLDALDRAALLFQPGTSERVLPINFNANREGRIVKGQFLCLVEDGGDVHAVLEKARTVLPVEGEFDRD